MNTKVLIPTDENIAYAAQLLNDGEAVGMPTETVYGLAANAFDENAVAKIFEAKGRPQDNPLIVHIDSLERVQDVVSEFSETALSLAKKFWPGPLTMILPKNDKIPLAVTAGLSTVAVRYPSHKVANALIHAAGMPLAAPSANLSGHPSPTTANHVYNDLKGRIPAILDGGSCEVGLESTVILLNSNGGGITLLRPGAVTVDMLSKAVPQVTIDKGVLHEVADGEKAASPGMLHKHYSPDANVVILDCDFSRFKRFVEQHSDEGIGALVFDGEDRELSVPCVTYGQKDDPVIQAKLLFSSLRAVDDMGVRTIYARMPSRDGIGLAIYNRLLRAAGFEVLTLSWEVGPMIVGLTGQTGAGKTTVSRRFAERGFGIVDCDAVSREVTCPGSPCLSDLTAEFGTSIQNSDGSLHRHILGEIVFSHREKLKRLNQIIFPYIRENIQEKISYFQKEGISIVILDAPTLFESGADHICDYIVSIMADAPLRQRRIMERDGLSEEDSRRRMDSQLPESFFEKHSDYIIRNNGRLEELLNQTDKAAEKIKEHANGH